jgi:hypothetical protein
MRDTLTGRWQLRICASFESSGLFVCLFVCLFVWGVNKASQEGALQRHPGIELFFNIPMYGGYDLGCHRRFPFYLRRDFHPFSRARITEGCVAYVLKSLSSWRRAGRRVFRFGKIVWDTSVLKGAPPEPAPLSSLLSTPTSADGAVP